METERSGCTRVRFTKPDKDGNVKQYIEKQDSRDIELKDLSGMESLAKADELMQQWAYETFDGDNIPMCEFIMLKLPEGYNGFFLHMDHRLIDSCGLVVMIEDLFQLYTHYRYGTACPQELVIPEFFVFCKTLFIARFCQIFFQDCFKIYQLLRAGCSISVMRI